MADIGGLNAFYSVLVREEYNLQHFNNKVGAWERNVQSYKSRTETKHM